ncbi:MAG TPA: NAD(P)H-dependent oxidoreductase subunit E, partial [Actinomycetota bacterium]|nr:NAD(P)H-dependent oxidoreductase subunit E [Actinomycetota bacterium]
MAVLTDDQRRDAETIIARYPEKRSAMLPLLYLLQSAEGHLSREGLQEVGELLGIRTAEVESVATFYTMFRMRPTGRYVVAVCTNVSCALLGAKRLFERAEEVLGPNAEEVTDDGAITLHEEECLGACEQAPLVQVNWLNYARMSEDGLVELLDQLRAGNPPPSTQGPRPADLRTTCRVLAGLGTPDGWFGPAVGADVGQAPPADHGEPPPETEGSGRTASEPQVDAP